MRFPPERPMRAAIVGLAATAAGVGVAELAAGLISPGASPITTVASLVIDLSPKWVKDLVIGLFGTGDKIALVVILFIVLIAGGAAAGLLEAVRAPLGRILLLLGGAIAVLAAMTRSGAGQFDFVPASAGLIAAIVLLGVLVRRREPEPGDDEGVTRRRFLGWVGGSAAAGLLAAVAGRVVAAGADAVEAVRSAFTLPEPAVAVAPIPAGAELDVPGITPLITPNDAFYRIDTALRVPVIDPADWSLRITGLVDEPYELTWDELVALPLEESTTTLTCVSNPVGGDLIGSAVWLGYPIRELLARAKVRDGADMVLSRSIDGFTASTPLEALQDDRNAILAIGMNGQPLPLEHGYPVRMVVPGLYGYVSATKWVVELEVTRFADATAYWTDRGWTERGPIKLSSRIDVPRGGVVDRGRVVVAGVAWQPHTGISAVQVQVDDGPWQDAELAEDASIDLWRQWRLDWDAPPGDHRLRVRAVDADRVEQSARSVDPFPNGAEGYHTVAVTVR